MPQIVPVQIDLRELLAIDPSARPGPRRLYAMREQHERCTCRSDRALILTGRRAEHESLWAEEAPALQEVREASPAFKGDPPRFLILRVLRRNDDLMCVTPTPTSLCRRQQRRRRESASKPTELRLDGAEEEAAYLRKF